MSESDGNIWFPAKKHGWGWGFPVTWQGWVVLLGYLVLVSAGVLLLKYGLGLFMLYVAAVSAALVGVCWFKGEKPTWR